MNPILPFEQLVVIALLAVAVGAIGAWRTAARASRPLRLTVTVLRILLVAALLVLALNPGSWQTRVESVNDEIAILVDRSASMKTADVAGDSRFAEATRLARRAARVIGGTVRLFPFAKQLEGAVDVAELERLAADGGGTDILGAGRELLLRYPAGSAGLRRVLLLSDGRQVPASTGDDAVMLARARGIPIDAVAIGGGVGRRDLSLRAGRRQVVAFVGQQFNLEATVGSEGFGPIRPTIECRDAGGALVDTRVVELTDGEHARAEFPLTLETAGYTQYRLRVLPWEGESRLANNEISVGVFVLDDDLRLLLLEGAPYWDSKFLAQLLRRQRNMQLTSIYRLSAERFFRVDLDVPHPEEALDGVFPDRMDALAPFDAVVVGKGIEYFLTPERQRLLEQFVRDRGGALIFARGKPYTGDDEALARLEPVVWGAALREDFRWRPTEEGDKAGLFGGAVPGADDPVWSRLPTLIQANRCESVRTFASVLAVGEYAAGGGTHTFPLVISQRFGNGIVVTVNAEGLWKWDFFPTEADASAIYQALWTQLLQWAVTYSEFLPGKRYALALSERATDPGQPVRARIAMRGADRGDAAPRVRIRRGEAIIRELTPVRAESQRPMWETVFSLAEPGSYAVELEASDGAGLERLYESLTVEAPLTEVDDVSADPARLREIAEATGGRLLSADEVEAAMRAAAPATADVAGEAEWRPTWPRTWALLLVLAIPAAEWYLRRRNGLK